MLPKQVHILNDYLSDYHTKTGEQRNIELADGSLILLNTNTAVSVYAACSGFPCADRVFQQKRVVDQVASGKFTKAHTLTNLNCQEGNSAIALIGRGYYRQHPGLSC